MPQTLLTLLQNSLSLSEADKKKLAAQLPTMSVEEKQMLEFTLIKETELVQQIDASYQNQAKALNKEYEQTVADFGKHAIKNMRISAEDKKRREDLRRADEILGSN